MNLTTPERRAGVDKAVRNEFLQQAGGRFYGDLARYRLIHAPLARTADDLAGERPPVLQALGGGHRGRHRVAG